MSREVVGCRADGGAPDDVLRELQEVRGKGSLSWTTSHGPRKTAETLRDEAALSARLVTDRLGTHGRR